MHRDLIANQINLFHLFLSERRFRTKVDSECSDWEDLLVGLPQGVVIGECICATFFFS